MLPKRVLIKDDSRKASCVATVLFLDIQTIISQRAGRRPARSHSFVGWLNCIKFVENRERRPITNA